MRMPRINFNCEKRNILICNELKNTAERTLVEIAKFCYSNTTLEL